MFRAKMFPKMPMADPWLTELTQSHMADRSRRVVTQTLHFLTVQRLSLPWTHALHGGKVICRHKSPHKRKPHATAAREAPSFTQITWRDQPAARDAHSDDEGVRARTESLDVDQPATARNGWLASGLRA